jgi:hypothetical protein
MYMYISIFIDITTRVINYIMLKYRIVDISSGHNQIIIFLIKNILEKVRPKSIYYYFTHWPTGKLQKKSFQFLKNV